MDIDGINEYVADLYNYQKEEAKATLNLLFLEEMGKDIVELAKFIILHVGSALSELQNHKKELFKNIKHPEYWISPKHNGGEFVLRCSASHEIMFYYNNLSINEIIYDMAENVSVSKQLEDNFNEDFKRLFLNTFRS